MPIIVENARRWKKIEMGARRSSTWDRRRLIYFMNGRSTASRSDSGRCAPSSLVVGVGGARACFFLLLLAWGSKCAFFLFLCMYPTSVVLPSRRGAPRRGGEASGVAPRYLSGAPKRYVLSAGHLSERAAGRWLASLGDDIVDLLTLSRPYVRERDRCATIIARQNRIDHVTQAISVHAAEDSSLQQSPHHSSRPSRRPRTYHCYVLH